MPTVDTLQAGLDFQYYLYCGSSVFLMQLGFAMLEVGTVRRKNSKNILIKNFMDACIGAIVWWACGYLIAFGSNTNRNEFAGSSNLATGESVFTPVRYQFWFFQFAFAATAASITSGAVAERCNMGVYFMYVVVLVGLVYPVVVHWCWSSDGWLSNFAGSEADDDEGYNAARTWSSVGVIDFAGSGVVHLTGGVSGFVGAYLVKPRTGRFTYDGEVVTKGFSPQSSTIQSLGTFILWFGWYAFNCGSTLVLWAGAEVVAARVAVTTTLSAASCALASFTYAYIKSDMTEYNLPSVMNGILGGLVSITAGCATVEPWAACVIGIIGAFVYHGCSQLMLKLNIDDVVDAVAVHGACGMWGVIAASIFSQGDLICEYSAALCEGSEGYRSTVEGIIYGGDGKLLGVALLQIISIVAWVGSTMTVTFLVADAFGMLRVTEKEEEWGMDSSHHGGMDDEAENSLGIDDLIKMKEDGRKLDKVALLAMCIVQNVAPLPMLAKFDQACKGGALTISNVSEYESLIEAVGGRTHKIALMDIEMAIAAGVE